MGLSGVTPKHKLINPLHNRLGPQSPVLRMCMIVIAGWLTGAGHNWPRPAIPTRQSYYIWMYNEYQIELIWTSHMAFRVFFPVI